MDMCYISWAIFNQGIFLRVVFSDGLSTVYLLYTHTNIWLYTLFLAMLLFNCTGEPEKKSSDYIKLHTSLPSSESKVTPDKQALQDIFEKATSSISCTFSEVNTTLPYFTAGVTLSEREIFTLEILQTLQRKNSENIKVEIILSKEDKCSTTGSLLLQYPFLASSDRSKVDTDLSSLLKHCKQTLNNADLNLKLSNEKQNGFQVGENIFYVNNEGRVKQNTCIIDDNLIFISANGINSQRTNAGNDLSFAIEMHSHDIAASFISEHGRLKNGLAGKWKSVNSITESISVQGVKINTIWGPQEKPLKYLTQALYNASSVQFVSQHMEVISFASGRVNEAVLSKVYKQSIITPSYFTAKGALDENSAYNGTYTTVLPCGINTPRCPSNIQLLKSGANHQLTGGLSLFLISAEKSPDNLDSDNHEILIFLGSISDEASYDDSLLLSLQSKTLFLELRNFLNELKTNSYTAGSNSGNNDNIGIRDVVINEILWMGSIDSEDRRHPSDEFIELYNTTANDIDISSWQIACTTDKSGLSASTIINLPAGALIEANQFLTISKTRGLAFANSDIISSQVSILNGTAECILIDNNPLQAEDYSHYQNNLLNGKIIDQVLSRSGDAWNLNASHYYSRKGLNTLKHNHPADGARSMERIDPLADGAKIQNWQTNVLSNLSESGDAMGANVVMQNIPLSYLARTYATPNAANSNYPTSTGNEDIKITEFNWMGSYDSTGTSHPEDEFIELYNNGSESASIGGWVFGCTNSVNMDSGTPEFAIPFGTFLDPGQFYIVSRNTNGAFIDAQYVSSDISFVNNTRSCLLTDGNTAPVSYVGSDGPDANTTLDGHYDHPLFTGTLKDSISNALNTLSTSQIGINDTVNRLRRSAERKWPIANGTLDSSWSSNSFTIIENIFLPLEYNQNTFATPGAPNSTSLGW